MPAPTGLAAPTVPTADVVAPGGLTPIDLSSSNPFLIVYVSVVDSGVPVGYWEVDLGGPTTDVALDLGVSAAFASGGFSLSFEGADGAGDVTLPATSTFFVAGPPPPSIVAGPSFAQCVALADPHLYTFDGLLYDCQPWGEVKLVHSATPNDMEVQLRTHPWGTRPDVSVNIAVAARVVTDRVAFYVDGTATLNAASVSFGGGVTQLPGGGTVYGVQNGYRVLWPDGSQLWVDYGGGYLGARVFLRQGTGRQVTGLCGNDNGVTSDDLTTADGQTTLPSPAPFAEFYGTYAEGWRVATDDSDSLFDYPVGETTANFTDLSFPHLLATTQGLNTTAAVAACAGAASRWQSDCVLDVALSGDTRFAAEYASTILPTAVATETIEPPVCAPPTFSPAPGPVSAGTAVTVSAPFVRASAIHLTTDGSIPTDGAPVVTGPVVVDQSETLGAIASLPGACTDSAPTVGAYNVAESQDAGSDGSAPAPDAADDDSPMPATCVPTGSLITPRVVAEAQLLGNGMVLVAGGIDTTTGQVLATAELFDPATGTFTGAGSMSSPRDAFKMTVLGNGKVLVTGGLNDQGGVVASADVYDPTAETWSSAGNMTIARVRHNAVALDDGTALVVGGYSQVGGFTPSATTFDVIAAPTNAAEIYNPVTNTFSPTGSVVTPRAGAGLSLLLDGRAFVVAGLSTLSGAIFTGSAEIYVPPAWMRARTAPFKRPVRYRTER